MSPQDYFADGMTDALITELAHIGSIEGDLPDVGNAVPDGQQAAATKSRASSNVEAVVEGTVLRAGGRVRITAQLIHAPTDRHLWAKSYERELRDVLALQAEVARAIAPGRPGGGPAGRAPDRPGRLPLNPDAYEAYLKGRFYWNMRGRENLRKAAGYFQQATAARPHVCARLFGVVRIRTAFSTSMVSAPSECMPKAEAAARKALALDDTLSEAHASLAGVLYRYHWDWDGCGTGVPARPGPGSQLRGRPSRLRHVSPDDSTRRGSVVAGPARRRV